MERVIDIASVTALGAVFGAGDKNLKLIERELKVKISLSSRGISVKGIKSKVDRAVELVNKMVQLEKEGVVFDAHALKHYLGREDTCARKIKSGIQVASRRKKIVFCQTQGQTEYIKAMTGYDIVFATGPAGTGKTYLAMAMAVNLLRERKVSRVILTRPAIEAGESLGFLPGNLSDKLAPYLRPLYDALYDMMDAEAIENCLEAGTIEIAPLAYMRGRTLNNAFVILDEAQNCTGEQLKMFLTRLGFDSKTVITGDITQSDLPGGRPVGLMEASRILRSIHGIKFIAMTKKDVVRHPLIQKIIQAYEDFRKEKEV